MHRFYEILEEEFKALLKEKTNWGRNDVMNHFHKAFAIAVTKYASELGVDLT